MAWIDVLHVWVSEGVWGPGHPQSGEVAPTSYTVYSPDGSMVWSETEEFTLADLGTLAAEYGITAWTPKVDEWVERWPEGAENEVKLIGFTEAPIARNEVERSYHIGDRHLPMVNVKVRNFNLPAGEEFDDLVAECVEDAKLLALPRAELRTLVESYLENDNGEWSAFYQACSDGYDQTTDFVHDVFNNSRLKTWKTGRSGGYFVVDGLGDPDTWDADTLSKWAEVIRYCKEQVDDIPRAMAWQVLTNQQAELAGRVKRVTITMVLCDEDLEEAGDPATDWDWRGMLDLRPASTIEVKEA